MVTQQPVVFCTIIGAALISGCGDLGSVRYDYFIVVQNNSAVELDEVTVEYLELKAPHRVKDNCGILSPGTSSTYSRDGGLVEPPPAVRVSWLNTADNKKYERIVNPQAVFPVNDLRLKGNLLFTITGLDEVAVRFERR